MYSMHARNQLQLRESLRLLGTGYKGELSEGCYARRCSATANFWVMPAHVVLLTSGKPALEGRLTANPIKLAT
jgi:hypothetical protein